MMSRGEDSLWFEGVQRVCDYVEKRWQAAFSGYARNRWNR